MLRDGSIGNWSKKCSDIVWCEALSQLESYPFGPTYKVIGTLDMMGKFAQKRF